MSTLRYCSLLLAPILLAFGAPNLQAEVERFDIVNTTSPIFDGTVYEHGSAYERIDASAYFAIDPTAPRVAGIVDIGKVPVGTDGKIRFSTEVARLSGAAGRPISPTMPCCSLAKMRAMWKTAISGFP